MSTEVHWWGRSWKHLFLCSHHAGAVDIWWSSGAARYKPKEGKTFLHLSTRVVLPVASQISDQGTLVASSCQTMQGSVICDISLQLDQAKHKAAQHHGTQCRRLGLVPVPPCRPCSLPALSCTGISVCTVNRVTLD